MLMGFMSKIQPKKKLGNCLAFNDYLNAYNKLDKIVFNVSLGRIAFSAKAGSAK